MAAYSDHGISKLMSARHQDLLAGWLDEQLRSPNARPDLISREKLAGESRESPRLRSGALERNCSGER